MIRLTRDRGTDHVDDRQRLHTMRLRLTQRRKTVRRLPGLAHDDHQGIRCKQESPIPEFRSELHTDRDLRQFLDHILCRNADMVSRSARHDIDLSKLCDLLL